MTTRRLLPSPPPATGIPDPSACSIERSAIATAAWAGAVVAGFRRARAPWAVVIDGDLQHLSDVIPRLLGRGRVEQLDLVGASRYQESGDADGLGERMASSGLQLCTFFTKMLFPRRLRGITDPMRGSLPYGSLTQSGGSAASRLQGAVEILARRALPNVADVAYTFQRRFTGRNKASTKQGLHLLQQLYILRMKTSWEERDHSSPSSPLVSLASQ